MSKTKFTAGPWELRTGEQSYVVGISTNPAIESPDVIATPIYSDRHPDEDTANMRLIAAAPELYEALEDALHNGLIYWQPVTGKGGVAKAQMHARIERVLAKARGETR